ncbi:MAG: Thioredoxin [Candidatus Moranbacteria bacterium GW2011_GWF1_34_10]|nr:MAG: Thioredoxin [Candidatus Moranbacteria bacterium GW2011_GWF1_34_10]
MTVEFTDKNFKEEVLESDKVVLVDFWAPWCGPCQMMGPIVNDLASELGEDFKVGKINVDENPQSASEYGIMSIPAIKIFKGGKIVKEFVGVQNKDTLKSELKNI